jgi:hypothetical protein
MLNLYGMVWVIRYKSVNVFLSNINKSFMDTLVKSVVRGNSTRRDATKSKRDDRSTEEWMVNGDEIR